MIQAMSFQVLLMQIMLAILMVGGALRDIVCYSMVQLFHGLQCVIKWWLSAALKLNIMQPLHVALMFNIVEDCLRHLDFLPVLLH